jgi:hypothetical protein
MDANHSAVTEAVRLEPTARPVALCGEQAKMGRAVFTLCAQKLGRFQDQVRHMPVSIGISGKPVEKDLTPVSGKSDPKRGTAKIGDESGVEIVPGQGVNNDVIAYFGQTGCQAQKSNKGGAQLSLIPDDHLVDMRIMLQKRCIGQAGQHRQTRMWKSSLNRAQRCRGQDHIADPIGSYEKNFPKPMRPLLHSMRV